MMRYNKPFVGKKCIMSGNSVLCLEIMSLLLGDSVLCLEIMFLLWGNSVPCREIMILLSRISVLCWDIMILLSGNSIPFFFMGGLSGWQDQRAGCRADGEEL
jgi:hypothetical protein